MNCQVMNHKRRSILQFCRISPLFQELCCKAFQQVTRNNIRLFDNLCSLRWLLRTPALAPRTTDMKQDPLVKGTTQNSHLLSQGHLELKNRSTVSRGHSQVNWAVRTGRSSTLEGGLSGLGQNSSFCSKV